MALIADSNSTVTLVLVPLFGIFATNIVGYLKHASDRRADRKDAEQRRQWEVEDRANKAREVQEHLEETARELRIKVEETARELQRKVDETAAQAKRENDARDEATRKAVEMTKAAVVVTQKAVAENTDLTKQAVATAQEAVSRAGDAYHEANSVNIKIADLHEMQIRNAQDMEKKADAEKVAASDQTDRIEAVGTDTNVRVQVIQDKVASNTAGIEEAVEIKKKKP